MLFKQMVFVFVWLNIIDHINGFYVTLFDLLPLLLYLHLLIMKVCYMLISCFSLVSVAFVDIYAVLKNVN